MAEQFDALTQDHVSFIEEQHIYFIGTAGADGRVNVSPKGMDSIRVLEANKVVWLNLTGSGNESAAHVLEDGRMTIMFCSYDRQPLILRLYGTADLIYPRHAEKWQQYDQLFNQQPGTRQFFELHVDLVQTSCGYAVPHYEYKSERDTLAKWATNRGEDGIRQYWADRNQQSLDGKPTEIIE